MKIEKWEPLAPEAIAETVPKLFHFSGKAVNSNAAALGVRIGSDRPDLPYVGVTTLPPGTVPLDYVRGAKDSGVLKQVSAVLEMAGAPVYEHIPPEERRRIVDAAKVLEHRDELGTERVDARLRQVLWPLQPELGEGSEYVALTPLPSAGLAALVESLTYRAEVDDTGVVRFPSEPDPNARKKYWARTRFELGGSNPQNVGRLIRSLGHPLVFEGPRGRRESRMAWRTHFRGLSWVCARDQIDRWLYWRESRVDDIGGDARSRRTEARHVRDIGRATLRSAHSRTMSLQREFGEGVPLVSDTRDAATRALLDPSLRDRDWPRLFARRLMTALTDTSFAHLRGATLQLSDEDARRLETILEQVAS